MNPIVYTKQLYSGYKKHEVLHGVDFAATKDQITGIIGPNGSGKSTLIKSIFGLCNITSGSIFVKNRDTTRVTTHQLMRYGVSYMAQTNNVFADLAIRENLAAANPDKDAISSVIEAFSELKPYYAKKAKILSGGLRQLLALAMLLINKPEIMLLDEPAAELSPKSTDFILEKIRQVHKEQKNCVIMVDQDVMRTLDFCDTVFLLTGGTVKYAGDPQTLLNDESLAKKYLGV